MARELDVAGHIDRALEQDGQRAQKRDGLTVGATLLAELSRIRCCRLIEKTGRAGRPKVHWQWEEMDPTLRELGETLQALPQLSQDVVYTP